MTERDLFGRLPWSATDPRALLVKIAWFERGGGARETAMLKRFSRKLARRGLIDRIRLDCGRVALALTPAGRDVLIGTLLEVAVGQPPRSAIGIAVQWTEARYIKRLLAAADEEEAELTKGSPHPVRATVEENSGRSTSTSLTTRTR